MRKIIAVVVGVVLVFPLATSAGAATNLGFVAHNQWKFVSPFNFAAAGGGFCSYRLHYRHGNVQFPGQPLTAYAESRSARVPSAANKCDAFDNATTLSTKVTIGNLTSTSNVGGYNAAVGAGVPAAPSIFASKGGAILGSEWRLIVTNPAGGLIGSDFYVASGI